MPVVLVHNEVKRDPAHQWDDLEGVHYNYPSKYRRLIQPGEPFVYYRGVHRVSGPRQPAEYFGAGRIGEIRKDPDRANGWYCAIDDYQRFAVPVRAKVEGENREQIPLNLWRDGVRDLDPAVYAAIMAEAGLAIGAERKEGLVTPEPAAVEPIAIEASDALIVPPRLINPSATAGTSKSSPRRSARAKAVGDWAERTALAYLRTQMVGSRDCIHRAAQGETPGWDIDFVDATGVLQRVEVKGTVGAAFTGVELTANELAAAEVHGGNYWLCLVANCETAHPKVQMVQNPAAKLMSGDWSARPSLIAVTFSSKN